MDPTLLTVCAELFHTPAGTAFADLSIDGHRETWPIRSRRFRAFLRRSYYETTGTAASAVAIKIALDQLEAAPSSMPPERAVHLRVAEHDGCIYLDLADDQWRAVEITPDGWRVIGAPPVRFRWPPGLLPLLTPQRGGLYTDNEEGLFQAARPMLLNGIEDMIGRPDLADRAIFVTMPPIAEVQRRSEAELWHEFERARATIMGAILDVAAHGLKMQSRVRLTALPRMADFVLWAAACETALWPAGTVARLCGQSQGRD